MPILSLFTPPLSQPAAKSASFQSARSFRNIVASGQIVDHDTKQAAELLEFLTAHANRIAEDGHLFQSEFEHLTAMCMLTVRDPELGRVLKDCGWTGNRYVSSPGKGWDVDIIIQALSNYYLKCTTITSYSSVANFHNVSIQTSVGRLRTGVDHVSPFCPETVVTALRAFGGDIKRPFSYPIVGACMLADISGFSAYSGRMCSRGVAGLDELRSVTNGLLGHFVRTVYDFGGDVMAFAGDALICIFPEKEQTSNCCVRALSCANLLCRDQSHHLSTHVAVTYGNMSVALIGGLSDQWAFLLTGECVNDLSECIQEAGAKQVAANAACINAARADVEASARMQFQPCNPEQSVYLVDINHPDPSLDPTTRLTMTVRSSSADYGDITPVDEMNVLSMLHRQNAVGIAESHADRNLVQSLIKFVPKPVKHALRGDVLDSIGELRQVTTLFLSLDSYEKKVHGTDPLRLQSFFRTAQVRLQESGGFLRQFLVDDKGCVLIAMWGVPCFSYANNCTRAVFFGVALQADLAKMGLNVSIGISTGMVFCGCVGAHARKDYVGIGTDVNIAARLMSKAKGRILIDSTTYQNCNPPTKSLLIQAELLVLKGMEEPMAPFKYNSDILPPLSETGQLDSTYLLQKRVTQLLDTQLDNISNAEVEIDADLDDSRIELPKAAVFLLGPAGSGKSTATSYFRSGAQKRGIKVICLQIQSYHKGVPYSVVKMLVLELISAGSGNDDLDAQSKLLQRLVATGFPHFSDADIEHAHMALEQILGRPVQSESLNRQATEEYKEEDSNDLGTPVSVGPPYGGSPQVTSSKGAGRVKARKDGEMVLCKVLQLLLSMSGPYAIILENGHMCDELSWRLINALFAERSLQLIVLVTVLVKVNVTKKSSIASLYKKDKRRSSENALLIDVDEILGNLSKSATSTSDISDLESLPRMSTSEGDLPLVDFGTNRSRITRKLESELPSGCLALMSRKFSEIVELGGLNHAEVKEILTASLMVSSVSDSLVQMVMDVSSGNPFWCNSIASFIKDRGLTELEEARRKSDLDSNSILRMLVVCRLDHLSLDELIVLKHASIIGSDFSYKLLQSIVPHKVFKHLDQHTAILVEQGFIRCFEEVPELKFCFANPAFQSTIYSLTLPTDAALVHQAIADCIEVVHQDLLQPFYPMLAYHYQRCGPQLRDVAFKFALKSADQAIAQGAFTEGLDFAKVAATLGQSLAELDVLLEVVTAGLDDIALARSPSTRDALLRKEESTMSPILSPGSLHSRNSSGSGHVGDKLTKEYQTLKVSVDKLRSQRLKESEIELLKTHVELSDSQKRKLLHANRGTSAALTWQASYASKRKSQRAPRTGWLSFFQPQPADEPTSPRRAVSRSLSTNIEHQTPDCCQDGTGGCSIA